MLLSNFFHLFLVTFLYLFPEVIQRLVVYTLREKTCYKCVCIIVSMSYCVFPNNNNRSETKYNWTLNRMNLQRIKIYRSPHFITTFLLDVKDFNIPLKRTHVVSHYNMIKCAVNVSKHKGATTPYDASDNVKNRIRMKWNYQKVFSNIKLPL